MANEGYHEAIDELTNETKDMHRAITSLMEELEAVDWYNQRVDACKISGENWVFGSMMKGFNLWGGL